MLSVLLTVALLIQLEHCSTVCCCAASERLDEAGLQLDALTSRLVRLSNKLDGLLGDSEQSDLNARGLAKKLDRVKGTNGACPGGFFPCSAGPEGSVQCVRNYLVCDGSADCNNGADEEKNVCVNPFEKAVDMTSVTTKATCGRLFLQTGSASQQTWTVQPATVIPWFPSRPQITWMATSAVAGTDATADIAYGSKACYDYATGDLIFGVANGLVAGAWQDVTSPKKTVFRMESARPGQEEPCHTGVMFTEN